MSIRMIGIDHNQASIEERELFSFTKRAAAEFLTELKKRDGIFGCALLSTCNRMELWVSCSDEWEASFYELLCNYKIVDSGTYRTCFLERSGYEAVTHLFYLTSGMKSQIIGEDQILTQVNDTLDFSRDNECTDKVLEVLFRMAVTAAKQVKTDIHLSAANSSIIHRVLFELQQTGYPIADKKCLVIGNGEMGKLAATKLKEEGADVTMTVRQYKSGVVEIPFGCNRINYGERYQNMDNYDLILSATASPNTTIRKEDLMKETITTPKLFIDLAVPRDIDPEIGKLDFITLYDIDHFQVEAHSDEMKEKIKKIEELLASKIEEFQAWYECKDFIPIIHTVSNSAANDVQLRIDKTVKKLQMKDEEKELLEESIQTATNKVIRKLMFGLRDTVSIETFQECVEAMKKIY